MLAVLALAAGCTFEVKDPQVQIDCVVVTVPLEGGAITWRDCDGGEDAE